MQLSVVGLILGGAYLAVPVFQAGKVLAKNSFGGLFSQEFGLFVVTMPASALVESLFKRRKYCRLAGYLVAAILNATLLYFLGMGLAYLVSSL